MVVIYLESRDTGMIAQLEKMRKSAAGHTLSLTHRLGSTKLEEC